MNAGRTIARLEALLARVVTRSGEPRVAARRHVAQPSALAVQAAEAAAVDDLLDEESDQPTIPPPAVAAASAPRYLAERGPAVVSPPSPLPPPHGAPALELSVDVDLAAEEPAPVEAFDRPSPVDAAGSRERLVAAAPAEMPSPVAEESGSAEMPAAAPAAEEEEAPVSSRRPLAPEPEERLAEMAFGATEPRPALHTPPPESGRLPAAPAEEFADEDTGVRAAVASPIVPETTKADLAGGERVAQIQGSVPAFRPSTFAELLDASLGL